MRALTSPCSGGKADRTAGQGCSRRSQLVDAALNISRGAGIGRGMKVGKEEIAGTRRGRRALSTH
jgi:hypothetical protein